MASVGGSVGSAVDSSASGMALFAGRANDAEARSARGAGVEARACESASRGREACAEERVDGICARPSRRGVWRDPTSNVARVAVPK